MAGASFGLVCSRTSSPGDKVARHQLTLSSRTWPFDIDHRTSLQDGRTLNVGVELGGFEGQHVRPFMTTPYYDDNEVSRESMFNMLRVVPDPATLRVT